MTFVKQPTAVQHHIFSYLNERDLHFAGRSCKTLQRTAEDNRLWKQFLEKRWIEPTENNKQRLTAFFKTSCCVFAESFKDRMSGRVKAELESQKADQLSMDDNNPLANVVLTRARHKEMTSKFVDIYDLYAAIWKSSTQSPEFIGSLSFHSVASGSADPDKIRFLRALGVDASKPIRELSALELLLENRDRTFEAVKLLINAKAGFSENRSVDQRRLQGTIDTAAAHCAPDIFRFLWNLHPQVSPTNLPHFWGTLGNACSNPFLVQDAEIIKMLLRVGTLSHERYGYNEMTGDIVGSLNLALFRKCTYDTAQALLGAGARPTRREMRGHLKFLANAGTLDIAMLYGCSHDILQLLLNNGATLSRADKNNEEWWPGTLEIAKQRDLPADSLKLLEEAAARGQFPPEEAPPIEIEEVPEIPAPQENQAPEEVIAHQPIQNLPPQAVDLSDVQDQNPEEEPDEINPLQQILPAWLWNAFMAIDEFISAIVMRIVNFFNQNAR